MTQVELHSPSETKLAEKVKAYQTDYPDCTFKIYFCETRKLWRASALRK